MGRRSRVPYVRSPWRSISARITVSTRGKCSVAKADADGEVPENRAASAAGDVAATGIHLHVSLSGVESKRHSRNH